MMWHTFAPGSYDFGATDPGVVSLSHEIPYLDMFFMVSPSPVGLLNDFYQLTGNPVLLPKFGFYEGHLNAYNRDYWKEDDNGILYEDGKNIKRARPTTVEYARALTESCLETTSFRHVR